VGVSLRVLLTAGLTGQAVMVRKTGRMWVCIVGGVALYLALRRI
jgi:hypothetical protein